MPHNLHGVSCTVTVLRIRVGYRGGLTVMIKMKIDKSWIGGSREV